jgi:hypothetical protein
MRSSSIVPLKLSFDVTTCRGTGSDHFSLGINNHTLGGFRARGSKLISELVLVN